MRGKGGHRPTETRCAATTGAVRDRFIYTSNDALKELDRPKSGATQPEEKPKNPAAVALGKLGGKKGGPARAAKLSAKRRKQIAKKAATARWNKNSQQS